MDLTIQEPNEAILAVAVMRTRASGDSHRRGEILTLHREGLEPTIIARALDHDARDVRSGDELRRGNNGDLVESATGDDEQNQGENIH